MAAPDLRELLKQASLSIEKLKARVDQLEREKLEPIAVVGVGCRFPGGAASPDAYWALLRDGVDAIREVPPDRWDLDEYFDPNPDAPGKMYSRWGGFLDRVDEFDPQFFGISRREAASMDPQQRLLAEVSWEALEHAGIRPDSLAGSQTGVFVGISTSDYSEMLRSNGSMATDLYAGTGNSFSIASGRLSYLLGLQGPCISIDTACSASLVGIHLAVESLRRRECALALVGGVNLMLTPTATTVLCKGRMLSFEGRCKTFDAGADGYVRGEGCGVVVLKRLSDASSAGDRVLAVVRGSAINQDGRSSGLTAPNGLAQEALLRAALKNASVSPADVGYVEAHGTGTPLGNPIEMRALVAVMGERRPADRPLLVGGVKTNIGHLEAAAGVAGFIKLVLAIQHAEIPPHLHLTTPNPHIAWSDIPVRVPTGLTAWPEADGRRIAGVSSFGFSGTNAHVILEAAPARSFVQSTPDRPLHLLPISGRSDAALAEGVSRFAAACDGAALELSDVAFTAATGRAHLRHRIAALGRDTTEVASQLRALAAGQDVAGIVRGVVPDQGAPKVALLFTGQGSQYVDMGRQLYDTSPAFRRTLDRCDGLLRPHLGESVIALLYGEGDAAGREARLADTKLTQPALFAIEYTLAELWLSWGVKPLAVMGHSLGEYVAACVAGVFSLEDALSLVAARARLMSALPAGGAMAAVFASETTVAEAVAPFLKTVSIAAVNGPQSVVVSGAGADVATVIARLAAKGIKAKALAVSHAFHSPLMGPMLDAFDAAARQVTYATPRIRVISNVTGKAAEAGEITRPEYWRRHIEKAVLFAPSVEWLHAQGFRAFVEVGPQATLVGMAARSVPDPGAAWLPSLRKAGQDWEQMLRTLAELYVRGVDVDWSAFDRDYARQRVALPTYPFERQRCWMDTTTARRATAPVTSPGEPTGHPLLGDRIVSPFVKEQVFQAHVPSDALRFVSDHIVYDTPVFPMTAFVEMAMAGARRAFGSPAVTLEQFEIEEALPLPDDAQRVLQIGYSALEVDGRSSFQVYSRDAAPADPQAPWTRHASGRVVTSGEVEAGDNVSLDDVRRRCATIVDVGEFYARFAARGIAYGPAFQGVDQVWSGGAEAFARLRLPEAIAAGAGEFGAHPALLDAGLQVLGAATPPDFSAGAEDLYLPVGIGRVRQLAAPGSVAWTHARFRPVEEGRRDALTADVRCYDDQGQLTWSAEGITLKRASSEALLRAKDRRLAEWLYEVEWQPAEPVAARDPTSGGAALQRCERAGAWLVLADRRGYGAALAARLEAAGASCHIVPAGAAFDAHAAIEQARRGGALAGVVHLWSLDVDTETLDPAGLDLAGEATCGSALALVQGLAAARLEPPPRLAVVTRGAMAVGSAPWPAQAAQAPMWGLARVIALEHPELRVTAIDLDPGEEAGAGLLASELLASSDDNENQVALRGGARYVARLVRRGRGTSSDRRLAIPAAESFQLATTSRGVLDNLTIEPRGRTAPGPGDVEIRVHAAGLNFRDVLNALGMYPGDPGAMGGECAGRVVSAGENVKGLEVGDEVLCLAGGAFSKYVVTPHQAVVRLPAGLTHEQAAGTPIAFLTAHYGLHHLATIEKGDRVLVHAAAGGVGQAAVQLALRAGAEVYGTAGSVEKRDFVRAMGVRHVFSSRKADFASELLALTGGRGVDVVLNSLTGAFISESLRVLAPGGWFLEIGKAEIWTSDAVAAVNPAITYRPFDLSEVMLHDIGAIASMFADVIGGMADGGLKPLPTRVFDMQDAMSAFRFMAQAKHVGKIVLSQRDLIAAESGTAAGVRADATYLITGGTGALGLEVATWLAGRGARRIVITGRSAPSSEAAAAIELLRSSGPDVTVVRADVASHDDLRRLLDDIAASGSPLRGVFHAAGVLDDGVLTEQTWPRFQTVMAPKVRGSWLLHKLTERERLDFFVLFSSSSAVLGSPGQGNYAAANAFMDALAHHRRAMGQPALSVSWGAWADAGMAARLTGRDQARMADRGIGLIPPDDGMRILRLLLHGPAVHVMVAPVRWAALLPSLAGRVPPMLRVIAQEAAAHTGAQASREAPGGMRRTLAAAPASERDALLASFVRAQVARVLGADAGQIDVRAAFDTLGLDSLMVVELRNALTTALECDVQASALYDQGSVQALSSYLSVRLADGGAGTVVVTAASRGEDAKAAAELLSTIDAMSDDKVDALLNAMLAEQGTRHE